MDAGGHFGGPMGGYNLMHMTGDKAERRPAKFIPGKVFIGGISPDTDNEILQAYCGQWGDIRDVHVMTGKNYAFVTFDNPADAQKFLDVRDHVINGRQVDAKAAVPRDQGGGKLTKKMFVGGVTDITDADFREYFSRFGAIEDASVLRKPDGTSRGYGFVTFVDEMAVEKCLVQEHVICGRTIDCKRALGRDQQQHPGGRQALGGGAAMMGTPAMMGAGMPMMGMMGAPGMNMMFPMGAMSAMTPMGTMMGSGGTGMMGGTRGGSERGPKQPEWTCGDCGNTNFAWRQFCNKCRQPRHMGGGMGGQGMMGLADGSMNPAAGMMGAAGAGMMMGAGGTGGMGGMQMTPMGMMGGMPSAAGMSGMNMMGTAGMGGMAAGMMNPAMAGGMGMMPGMDGSMGTGSGAGSMMGNTMYGGRMGGRGGSAGGQTRFRPY